MGEISYLKFNGIDFTNFVNFVKSMNFRDKVKNSKSVVLHVEDNKLVCRAIDDNKHIIEYYVDLLEFDNIISEPIALSITDLYVLVKSANNENKFTIRKNFGQYEFNIIGDGWIPFNVCDADINKYAVEGDKTDIGEINSAKLRNVISFVLGYTQDYTYNQDKYIRFKKDQMNVTSRLSSVITSDWFVEMTLHRDDAALLKSLLKDDFTLNIVKVVSSIERLVFIGQKFKLAIVASETEDPNITTYTINDFITIDCDELYKLAMFSEEYSASKHLLGLSIKNGTLNVNIKNILASRYNSTVSSVVTGDVKDTSIEAEISSRNLLKVLKLFQDKRSRNINIYINDDMLNTQNCIVIFDKNTQAITNISR